MFNNRLKIKLKLICQVKKILVSNFKNQIPENEECFRRKDIYPYS